MQGSIIPTLAIGNNGSRPLPKLVVAPTIHHTSQLTHMLALTPPWLCKLVKEIVVQFSPEWYYHRNVVNAKCGASVKITIWAVDSPASRSSKSSSPLPH